MSKALVLVLVLALGCSFALVAEAAQPAPPPASEGEPRMSEGRRIVSLYNTDFQWGLSPGLMFSGGASSFFLGLRLGYGFDTGTVILVPGVHMAGYFTDPSVYVAMPIMKLVLPADRFAPFVEAGAGVGYINGKGAVASQTGAAFLVGAGFMLHFSLKFGLGVEANVQVITGTGFEGVGLGPVVALAF